MKVWLDDLREAPEGWVRAYWPEDVITHLKTGFVTQISLDHDLGIQNGKDRNAMEVINWIEEQVVLNKFVPPEIFIHSANSVGIGNLRRAITQIEKYHTANQE